MGPLATPTQALWDIDNRAPKIIGGIRESTERLAPEPGREGHPQVGAGPGVWRDAHSLLQALATVSPDSPPQPGVSVSPREAP